MKIQVLIVLLLSLGQGLIVASELKRCPSSPNCVSSMHEDDQSHYIQPIQLSKPIDFHTLETQMEKLKRVSILKKTDCYLHVVFTSLIFRFKDDVEFVLNDQGTLVHVRSASRLGHYDFGVNRKRVEKIRQMLVNL